MASLSEDSQSTRSDTRPPMLERSNFASWQQRIRLYCMEKENGENIIKSIDEGPFKIGKFREALATKDEGALHLGTERDRVVADLTPEEKESGLKDSNHDQVYAYLKQHEVHANENKMLFERFNQQSNDQLALMSNVSPSHYPSSSSVPPQTSYILPVTHQPRFADNKQLDTGPPLTHGIKLWCRMAGLWFRMFRGDRIGFKETMLGVLLQQEIGELRTELENGVDLDEKQLLFLAGGQTNTFDDDVDEGLVQDMAQKEENIF
ncbi:hypothetical protein Tco_0454463 [Tanacetum coccineum]